MNRLETCRFLNEAFQIKCANKNLKVPVLNMDVEISHQHNIITSSLS